MSEARTIRVATDVGGTFTDLVLFETDHSSGKQRVVTAKTDTTPPNFEQGVLEVLKKPGVRLADISVIAHGTTVVINALTERKGVKTGLITTLGFRDVLEVTRGNRPDFFNLKYVKPPPFVPRHLRLEVPGRMSYRGEEREPLDTSGLPDILEHFRREGVQAVAICLLHAYANPAHEQRVLDEVRSLWPDVSVVASHQITREWREYERSNTTVLSAYVQPTAERYLGRLEEGLQSESFQGQLYIMQSNCGVDSVGKTKQIPITMVESGPASGVLGAAELGKVLGEPNILALDIGGTTAKCSLIEGAQVSIKTDYWIERDHRTAGYPIMVPVVDLVEIGNGGGSIAWVDAFGKLHVGPQSAGAQPGPAAYGRGGNHATTTDANLALGRINPDYFCGGTIKADMAATNLALETLAQELGTDRSEVARGIVRIANSNMVNALKLVSLNRGHDPRDFTLMAFGGGGGMHAVALAKELGIAKVIIPRGADVFSAWGMMMSDLRRDYFLTRIVAFEPESAEALTVVTQAVAEVQALAYEQFSPEGIAETQVQFQRFAKLRYTNQEHSVEVPLPAGQLSRDKLLQTASDFHDAYEKEYTYRLDAAIEFVGLHIVAYAEVGKLEPSTLPVTGRSLRSLRKGQREVDFALEGVHPSDVYDGELLEPEMHFAGPAVVETSGSTVVVHPGCHVRVDAYGNLHIHLEVAAA